MCEHVVASSLEFVFALDTPESERVVGEINWFTPTAAGKGLIYRQNQRRDNNYTQGAGKKHLRAHLAQVAEL